MSLWSLEDAIAMERRHILEGDQRVARQAALVARLTEHGRHQVAGRAKELLDVLCDIQRFARERLRQLETAAASSSQSD